MIRKENFFFLSVSNISIITYPLHFFNVAILFLDSFIYNCFIVIFVLLYYIKGTSLKKWLNLNFKPYVCYKKKIYLSIFFVVFLNVCIFDISAHQATNCGFCMNCKSKSIFASRSDFFLKKIILCIMSNLYFSWMYFCMIDCMPIENKYIFV